jgi:hypothetical protein
MISGFERLGDSSLIKLYLRPRGLLSFSSYQ